MNNISLLPIEQSMAFVKKGRKLVNKDKPLTRITLVPDAHQPDSTFALIFSQT